MRVVNETLDKRAVEGDMVHQIQVRDNFGTLISDPSMTLLVEKPDGSKAIYAVGTPQLATTATTGVYNVDVTLVGQVGDWFFTIKPSDGNWHVMYVPVGE